MVRSSSTLFAGAAYSLFGCAFVACIRTQAQAPMPLVSAAAQCANPVSHDVWSPLREERVDSSTSFYHPAWPTRVVRVPDARMLAGVYDVVFVATSPDRGPVVRGALSLVATHAAMTDLRGLADRMPLIGWASIDLEPLGYLPLAHPLSRRDPGRPGVQLDVDAETGRLSGVAGNSLEFRDGSLVSKTTHVGVWLYFFSADTSGFTGRWSGGGLAEPGTEGYFCGTKVGPPPPNDGW